MPINSTPDPTPASAEQPEGWALPIPFLSVNGYPVQLKGRLPSYHAVIHFVGYAGIVRTALAVTGPTSVVTEAMIYAGCILMALITGWLVQMHKSERFPRMCSAALGLSGFTAAAFASDFSSPSTVTTHGWTAFLVPLCAMGFMITLYALGEALTRLCPRQSVA